MRYCWIGVFPWRFRPLLFPHVESLLSAFCHERPHVQRCNVTIAVRGSNERASAFPTPELPHTALMQAFPHLFLFAVGGRRRGKVRGADMREAVRLQMHQEDVRIAYQPCLFRCAAGSCGFPTEPGVFWMRKSEGRLIGQC